MDNWQTRLDRWVRAWDRLPEMTRDCFPVRPPARRWPPTLPACPAFGTLYARCDGGEFGPYHLRPAAELSGDLGEVWLDDPEPGRWVRIGDHECGHALLWDGRGDLVATYSPDDGEPEAVGRAEEFLRLVFYPSAKPSADATQFWAESLAAADELAKPDTGYR